MGSLCLWGPGQLSSVPICTADDHNLHMQSSTVPLKKFFVQVLPLIGPAMHIGKKE
jgi:hypothetical protein